MQLIEKSVYNFSKDNAPVATAEPVERSKKIPVVDGMAVFNGVRFPVDPMILRMGAPKTQGIPPLIG